MNFEKISGANRSFSKPKDWDDEKQGPCFTIPVRLSAEPAGLVAETAWSPTPDELAALNAGAFVVLRVVGGQPPVSLYVETKGGIPVADAGDVGQITARMETVDAGPTKRSHKWIPSRLGHGETQCVYCKGTNREIAVIGDLDHCEHAPVERPNCSACGRHPEHAGVQDCSEVYCPMRDNAGHDMQDV